MRRHIGTAVLIVSTISGGGVTGWQIVQATHGVRISALEREQQAQRRAIEEQRDKAAEAAASARASEAKASAMADKVEAIHQDVRELSGKADRVEVKVARVEALLEEARRDRHADSAAYDGGDLKRSARR